MQKARLLWVGFSGKSNCADTETLKTIGEKLIFDFCAVVTHTRSLTIDNFIKEILLMEEFSNPFGDMDSVDVGAQILNKSLLAEVAMFEGETLRMMDRYSVGRFEFKKVDGFDTRRRFFYFLCASWSEYLRSRNITHVVFNGVPHTASNFVAYKLAKFFKLKVIILAHEKAGIRRSNSEVHYAARFPVGGMSKSTFFIAESIEEIGNWELAEKIKFGSYDAKYSFINGVALDRNLTTPTFVSKSRNYFLSLVRDVSLIERRPAEIVEFIRSALKSDMQRRMHIKLSDPKQLNCKEVLFCLAFQPEESTSPRAGIFVEQYLAIAALSKALPSGWLLRVREHPDQYGRRIPRSDDYLKCIGLLPNVKIVSPNEPLETSLAGVKAVAACAGSVLIEAWRRNIPVLTFGHNLLKNAPGVFFIEDFTDLVRAIEKVDLGFSWTPEQIEEFISFLSERSFRGSLGKISNDNSLKTDTVRNLVGIVTRWVKLKES